MLNFHETSLSDVTDVRVLHQPRVSIIDIAEHSIVYSNASTDVAHDPSGRVLFILHAELMLQSATPKREHLSISAQ